VAVHRFATYPLAVMRAMALGRDRIGELYYDARTEGPATESREGSHAGRVTVGRVSSAENKSSSSRTFPHAVTRVTPVCERSP
jgi:hypothetical protein